MSKGGAVFTPTNQKRHTNIAVVRMKKGGKRFEIACYKNKVMSWRQKVETDLDEVVQTHSIFTNVSKGQLAKADELQKAFNSEDQEKILLIILEKGELQVSDKERSTTHEATNKEIATIVSEKCVNPETKTPYTVTMIEAAMKDLHFNINPKKNSKQQALDLIKSLKEHMPIERAQMKVRIFIPGKNNKQVKEKIVQHLTTIQSEEHNPELCIVALIDPGSFRVIEETVSAQTKGKGNIQVMNLKAMKGDAQAEDVSL